MMEMTTNSVAETVALGEALGRQLHGGEVIGLVGELGTGKTHFIKGLAQGLAVPAAEAITSPTFVLMGEYQGRLPLYHIDAYRLEDARQLEAIGFDEWCGGPAVVVVEWADRVWTLVEEYRPIGVYLRHAGQTTRVLRFEGLPDYVKMDQLDKMGG